MAGGELDPRHLARFQRGYDPATDPAPSAPEPATGPPDDEDEAADAPSIGHRPSRGPAVALLLAAVVLVGLAGAAAAWNVLDPGFTVPPEPDPFGAGRRAAVAVPGPLVVAAVVAIAAGLRAAELPRRVSSAVAGATGVALIALVARASAGAARLASLTAQGPVSSGGIPLPPAGMATYYERMRSIMLIDASLPWLALAAALAVVVAVAAAGGLLSRRPAA